jgi:hypothetical protein
MVTMPPAAGWATSSTPPHDYVLHCAGCHKFDGSGSARVPALTGIRVVIGHEGWRDYLVRVPGVAQAPLTDARLADLLNWVLERFAGATPGPAFTAGEMGRLRARPLRDPGQARARLLAPATD